MPCSIFINYRLTYLIEDKIFTLCEKMGVTVEEAVTKIDDEIYNGDIS